MSAVGSGWKCFRCFHKSQLSSPLIPIRHFSIATHRNEELQTQISSTPSPPSPPTATRGMRRPWMTQDTVIGKKQEKALLKRTGKMPVGSRRRRLIIRTLDEKGEAGIPFTQLPYQCFQEARKYLAEDRKEKIAMIEQLRLRIANLMTRDVAEVGGEMIKQHKLDGMKKTLEEYKIRADVNDPLVKKTFEDGKGDMNKPIYRYLADKKWREMRRKILMQRITQMSVIPDVLPHIDPIAAVEIRFGRKVVQSGDFVLSARSETPPTLDIQVFDKGERLVTIVAIDSDVPNEEKDGFDYRCHGVWTNVAIDPTKPIVSLENLAQENVMFPWMPPFAQKGSPYHRISLFILQQVPLGKADASLNIEPLSQKFERDGFVLRSFIARCEIDQRIKLKPVGINMFRCEWDDDTEELMKRHGIPGWDVEYKREKVLKLPYFKKDGERYR